MKIKTLKSLALGLLVGTAATAGYSQGTINFFTFNSGANSLTRGSFYLPGGTALAGSTATIFDAQLWGNTTSSSVSAASWNAIGGVFQMSQGAGGNGGIQGTVNAGVVTDNSDSVDVGGTSDAGNFEWYTVRVWDSVGNTINTWAATGLVWSNGGGGSVNASGHAAGISAYGVTAVNGNVTRVQLGGTDAAGDPPFTPQQSSNFANLTLTATPEPTTLALAGLGGAALLAFRRRKA